MVDSPSKSKRELNIVNSQFELFSTNLPDYVNSFHFYESLPRYILGKRQDRYIDEFGDIKNIVRSGKLAEPITKSFLYKKEAYTLEIKPTSMMVDGVYKSVFPGVIEKTIEAVLFKIASDKGEILERDGKSGTFALRTTYYEISKALKKITGTKNSPYNNKQIKQSLDILRETNLKYKKDIEDVKAYQSISSIDTLTIIENDDSKNGTVEIIFNVLSTKAILSKEYRPVNYLGVMIESSQLAKWLKQRMYMNFTYANPTSTYNINYKVIMNESGSDPIATANRGIKKVLSTIKELDIVKAVDAKNIYKINPKTKRKMLDDCNFEIWPTREFIEEQIKINVHLKWLSEAVQDEDGNLVYPPKKEDYLSTMAFTTAHRKYKKLGGKKT